MALDFHSAQDSKRQKVLYCLTHEQLSKMSEGLVDFENKTGIFVDEYGTTRLEMSNIALLAKCIVEYDRKFAEFLHYCTENNIDLIAEGD